MNKDTGGPAFPRAGATFNGPDGQVMGNRASLGMTLRDYFAAKAMQGLCAGNSTDAQQIARAAYIVADAMLKARGKTHDERLAQPEQEPATKAGELRAMKEEFWKQPDRPMIPDDFPREGLTDD